MGCRGLFPTGAANMIDKKGGWEMGGKQKVMPSNK